MDGKVNGRADARNPQLDELISHFARMVKVLAMTVVKDQKQEVQIALLNGFGYTAAEIAQLVGTTPNTVSVSLYQMKKKKGSLKNK